MLTQLLNPTEGVKGAVCRSRPPLLAYVVLTSDLKERKEEIQGKCSLPHFFLVFSIPSLF